MSWPAALRFIADVHTALAAGLNAAAILLDEDDRDETVTIREGKAL